MGRRRGKPDLDIQSVNHNKFQIDEKKQKNAIHVYQFSVACRFNYAARLSASKMLFTALTAAR